VSVVHCGFDVDAYEIRPGEVERFRRRFGLDAKPIIYLGKDAPGKGVERARKLVRSSDFHLVTTGNAGRSDDSVIRLLLDPADYRCLLKASTLAMALSDFDEGWCRVAHEAMLCGTPVVGSGRGGMRELLEGGSQVIASHDRVVISAVDRISRDASFRNRIGAQGRSYARRFDLERFGQGWLRLIMEEAHEGCSRSYDHR